MKRPTLNADLLKNISSRSEIKELLLQIKKHKKRLSCNAVEPTALIISALKSKIKKSLYVVVEEDDGVRGLAKMCSSLLGLSVYEIKKSLNNEAVPGFFSENNHRFEISCGALLGGLGGLYIISKQNLSYRLRCAPQDIDNEIKISVEKQTSQKEASCLEPTFLHTLHHVLQHYLHPTYLQPFVHHPLHLRLTLTASNPRFQPSNTLDSLFP